MGSYHVQNLLVAWSWTSQPPGQWEIIYCCLSTAQFMVLCYSSPNGHRLQISAQAFLFQTSPLFPCQPSLVHHCEMFLVLGIYDSKDHSCHNHHCVPNAKRGVSIKCAASTCWMNEMKEQWLVRFGIPFPPWVPVALFASRSINLCSIQGPMQPRQSINWPWGPRGCQGLHP